MSTGSEENMDPTSHRTSVKRQEDNKIIEALKCDKNKLKKKLEQLQVENDDTVAVISTLRKQNMALHSNVDRQCEMEKENCRLRKRLDIYEGL